MNNWIIIKTPPVVPDSVETLAYLDQRQSVPIKMHEIEKCKASFHIIEKCRTSFRFTVAWAWYADVAPGHPEGTRCDNDVIMMSKRRRDVVLMS